MRVLGVGETCDLGALYMSLVAERHEVRVAVSHPLAQGTMAGLVDLVSDWRAQLDWVRAAGPDGLVLFESVSSSAAAPMATGSRMTAPTRRVCWRRSDLPPSRHGRSGPRPQLPTSCANVLRATH